MPLQDAEEGTTQGQVLVYETSDDELNITPASVEVQRAKVKRAAELAASADQEVQLAEAELRMAKIRKRNKSGRASKAFADAAPLHDLLDIEYTAGPHPTSSTAATSAPQAIQDDSKKPCGNAGNAGSLECSGNSDLSSLLGDIALGPNQSGDHTFNSGHPPNSEHSSNRTVPYEEAISKPITPEIPDMPVDPLPYVNPSKPTTPQYGSGRA